MMHPLKDAPHDRQTQNCDHYEMIIAAAGSPDPACQTFDWMLSRHFYQSNRATAQ